MDMKANIEHANGKMIVTTARGDVATRKTDVPYKAAIVGRRNRDGKMTIIFASNSASDARSIFAAIPYAPKGSRLHCRYSYFSGIDLVVQTDAALKFDDGLPADAWVPEDDPDAWKARDDALIAAARNK